MLNYFSFNFHAVHQLYVLPVFTQEFCRDFVEELDHFNETNLPKGRPNTMNNYGVCLKSISLQID